MSTPAVICPRKHLLHLQTLIPPTWQSKPPPPPPQLPQPPPVQLCTQKPPSLPSLIASIKAHSTHGHLSNAFTCYSLLYNNSYSSFPLLGPLSFLLSCSTSLKALSQGLQLHAHVIILGFLNHPSLVSRLTSLYVALDVLSDALIVVKSSNFGDVLPWNLLISGYVRGGFSSKAVLAYQDMVINGVEPDRFTFPSVLSACGEIGDLDFGRDVHRRIDANALGCHLFVKNALVAMYAKCGALDVARKLFDEMLERDVVSWNSIISGYAAKGMWEEAFELFNQMQVQGSEVNVVSWNTIAGGHLQMGNPREALRLISQMIQRGSPFDFVTMVIGLNACSRFGSLRIGKEFHGLVVRKCCDAIESVRNAMITMYSRCRKNEQAYILFRMAGDKSLVTWNAMIAGFSDDDQAEEASSVFQDMVRSGLQPNYVTVVTILSLCARVANLQHGRELHCYIIKFGFKGYRLLWNALVDMYSKSGRISVAQRVFDMMNDHDGISYTSLIAGHGMQGEGVASLKLFNEMIDGGIKPDHISMVAILTACSHSRLVSEGEMLFDKMVYSYGIVPRMEHYSCMVDLYARAGLLSKAEDMLDGTPFPPTAAMWAALLGACQIHKDTKIGERAARKLLDMRTDNAGHYVLIANMYAAAGCWQELATVRTLMRDMGVRKAPGCAWADLGNGFHPFLVGDRSSPISEEIYIVLEGLSEQMRDAGHIGSEDLWFDEEDVG